MANLALEKSVLLRIWINWLEIVVSYSKNYIVKIGPKIKFSWPIAIAIAIDIGCALENNEFRNLVEVKIRIDFFKKSNVI